MNTVSLIIVENIIDTDYDNDDDDDGDGDDNQ